MRKLMEAAEQLDEYYAYGDQGTPSFSVGLANSTPWAELSFLFQNISVNEMDKYKAVFRTYFEDFKKAAAKKGFEITYQDKFQIYVGYKSVCMGTRVYLKDSAAKKKDFVKTFDLGQLWD